MLDNELNLFLNNSSSNLPRTLNRINFLLEKLNNPQRKIENVIHIAGTNGKGSVLSYLKSCLEIKKLKVNALISPHLKNVNERIIIHNNEVEDDLLKSNLANLKKISNSKKLAFFEIITACAFDLFGRFPADWSLIEVGMGGEYDATNSLIKKDLAVITPISLDHEYFLGNNIIDIAKEKLGISNKNTLTVVGDQTTEVNNFIIKNCLTDSEKRFVFNMDWTITKKNRHYYYQDNEDSIKIFNPLMNGYHQKMNAALSIASIQCLRKVDKIDISIKDIELGVEKTSWSGRLERLSQTSIGKIENLEIWIDGCHNPAGSKVIASEMQKINNFECMNMIMIFSLKRSKKIKEFISNFKDIFSKFIYVEMSDDHYSYEEIEEYLKHSNYKIEKAESLEYCLENISKNIYSRVLICGSLQLVGNIIEKN